MHFCASSICGHGREVIFKHNPPLVTTPFGHSRKTLESKTATLAQLLLNHLLAKMVALAFGRCG
jgi:hypothetical protein